MPMSVPTPTRHGLPDGGGQRHLHGRRRHPCGHRLTIGVDALQFNGVDPDTDVAAFNGSRGDQADFSAYAIINNPANWITQDGTGDQSADGTAPHVPFSTESFTVGGAGNEIGGIAILDQAESLQGSVAAPVATNALTVSRLGSWLSGDGEGGSSSSPSTPRPTAPT